MDRVLFLDPFGGAAGNMVLAALIDAGADEVYVRGQLEGLSLPGWQLLLSHDRHQGLAGLRAVVEVSSSTAPARRLENVRTLLTAAPLDPRVRERSLAVFERLFEAEASVHGVPVEQAHLHEISAVDAVVDVVGSCAALVSLEVGEVLCGPVPVGRGTVETEHGLLPIPPPAVASLLQGVPLASHAAEGEMTTPTGAALLVSWSSRFGSLPAGRLVRVGVGLGTRRFDGMANVFRAFVLEVDAGGFLSEGVFELVEATVDDRTGEELGFILDRLRAAGARDAWLLSGVGRKGRPLVEIRALVFPDLRAEVLECLFSEGFTLGARVLTCLRPELVRHVVEVVTPFGTVPVKVAGWRGRVVSVKPEADVVQELARLSGRTLGEIEGAARSTAPQLGEPYRGSMERSDTLPELLR